MRLKVHTNMRKSISAFAVKAFISALALFVFAFPSVHAAGLGKLTVLSALGQPLRAELELTSVAEDEAGSIVVKLASYDAYRQAKLEFSSALLSLRFAVEKRGERHFVRVSSGQQINEPFVGMLLELRSNSGTLTREYTFLLDPAELRNSSQTVVAPPAVMQTRTVPQADQVQAPAQTSEDKPVKRGKAAKAAAAKAAAEAKAEAKVEAKAEQKAKQADAKQGGSEYKVKKGDTLAVIAKTHKHEEVTLEQMLVAIYRGNPEAFAGNNMNRLRVGKVLSVPDANAAAAVTKSEAKKVIVAQASDFTNYRNKLAGHAAEAAPQQPAAASQAAGGKITTKVEERAAAAKEAQDKLKLSKAAASASAGASKAGAVVSAEDKAAKAKAAADDSARVKELEKNISDLQGVLDARNKQMADKQKQAEQVAAQKQSAPVVPKPAVAPAVSAPAASVPQAAKPLVKKVLTPPPPPPEPSFFDELLDNPIMLGAGALVLALLVLLGVRSARNKNQAQQPLVGGTLAPDSRDSPNSLFGSAGGQSVDTNNSIFNSGFTPSASLLDANEVDPIAEADVYIAYGREAQAVEILKEALRSHPERNALRVKLLEIYASQKDVNAFDLLAGELYGLTRGEGEEWVYAAGLGVVIDPNNPLYAGGDLSAELLDRPTSLQGSMTQPATEHDPEVLLATPRVADDLPDLSGEPTPEQVETPDLPLDIAFTASDEAAPALDEPSPAVDEPAMDFDFPAIDALQTQATDELTDEIKASPDTDSVDFDLGVDETKKEAAQEPNARATMDFELGDLSFKQDEPSEPIEATGMSVSEVSESDFDQMMAFKPPVQVDSNDDELEMQLSAANLELEAIDKVEPLAPVHEDLMEIAHTQAAPEAPTPAASAKDFDFGTINLDLQPLSTPTTFDEPMPRVAVERSGSVEMDTKIDLADAYLGIGDKEGARELLDEVIQDGSPEQVERAKAALAKIS